jgi:hypothetical protein
MSTLLLAEFETARAAGAAARAAAAAGRPPMDVLSPNLLDGVVECLAAPRRIPPIGWVQVAAGALGAVTGYALQWYSAVVDYPIDSGGRPLNSWQVFLIVPYEMTILFAAVVGLLAWMVLSGLPRLHHPLFASVEVERAVQDRYLLVFAGSDECAAWILHALRPHALHEIAA